MIFLTTFDPTQPHNPVIGFSEPSSFPTVADAVAVMGPPAHQSARLALYPGLAVSDYVFAIDAKDNKRQKYEPPQVFRES